MTRLTSGSTVGVLYAEDFDDPPPAALAAPEPAPAPLIDAAQLEAACQTAYADGVASGAAQAAQHRQQASDAALAAIAAALGNADAAAVQASERSADAIAGLLLACLRRVLPELCRRHGAAEARAVARAVLPGLLQEPQITIRADAGTAAAVAAELRSHDPDLAARLRVQVQADMAPGDVRLAWADGYAQRDAGALWRAIAAALQPAGLSLPEIEPPAGHVPATDPTRSADAAADPPTPTATPNPQTKELEHAG